MANNADGKAVIHCFVGPDARLGVVCKRRGQNLLGFPKSRFLAIPSNGFNDAQCVQCLAQVKSREAAL